MPHATLLIALHDMNCGVEVSPVWIPHHSLPDVVHFVNVGLDEAKTWMP
jgi:hypothetical protein